MGVGEPPTTARADAAPAACPYCAGFYVAEFISGRQLFHLSCRSLQLIKKANTTRARAEELHAQAQRLCEDRRAAVTRVLT